jgi:hypothetical protein
MQFKCHHFFCIHLQHEHHIGHFQHLQQVPRSSNIDQYRATATQFLSTLKYLSIYDNIERIGSGTHPPGDESRRN